MDNQENGNSKDLEKKLDENYDALSRLAGRVEQRYREQQQKIDQQNNKRSVEKEHSRYLRGTYGNSNEARHSATYWADRHGSRGLDDKRRRSAPSGGKTVSIRDRVAMGAAVVPPSQIPSSSQTGSTVNPFSVAHPSSRSIEEQIELQRMASAQGCPFNSTSPIQTSSNTDAHLLLTDNNRCPVINCEVQWTSPGAKDNHFRRHFHSPCNPMRHLRNGNLEMVTRDFACPICTKVFPNHELCYNHMREAEHAFLMEPVSLAGYACPQCLLLFPSPVLTVQHMEQSNHQKYLYAYKEDAASSVAHPVAMPTVVVDEFRRHCLETTWSCVCTDCDKQLLNNEVTQEHLNKGHFIMSTCDMSADEVFGIKMLKNHTCVQCQRLFDTLPAEGYEAIHSCRPDVMGMYVETSSNCDTFAQYVLRYALSPADGSAPPPPAPPPTQRPAQPSPPRERVSRWDRGGSDSRDDSQSSMPEDRGASGVERLSTRRDRGLGSYGNERSVSKDRDRSSDVSRPFSNYESPDVKDIHSQPEGAKDQDNGICVIDSDNSSDHSRESETSGKLDDSPTPRRDPSYRKKNRRKRSGSRRNRSRNRDNDCHLQRSNNNRSVDRRNGQKRKLEDLSPSSQDSEKRRSSCGLTDDMEDLQVPVHESPGTSQQASPRSASPRRKRKHKSTSPSPVENKSSRSRDSPRNRSPPPSPNLNFTPKTPSPPPSNMPEGLNFWQKLAWQGQKVFKVPSLLSPSQSRAPSRPSSSQGRPPSPASLIAGSQVLGEFDPLFGKVPSGSEECIARPGEMSEVRPPERPESPDVEVLQVFSREGGPHGWARDERASIPHDSSQQAPIVIADSPGPENRSTSDAGRRFEIPTNSNNGPRIPHNPFLASVTRSNEAQPGTSSSTPSNGLKTTKSAGTSITGLSPPGTDTTTSTTGLYTYIKSDENIPNNLECMRQIVFLDLDNWRNFWQKLPDCLPDFTFVWAFYGGATSWKEPHRNVRGYWYAKQRGWFHLHKKCGHRRDAADFAICLMVGKMDERLPKHIAFTILSGDHGFLELEEQLKSSSRRTKVINPHHQSNEVIFALIASMGEA